VYEESTSKNEQYMGSRVAAYGAKRKVVWERDKREFNVHVKSTIDFEVKTKRDRDSQREPRTIL
jgi:hypothetical protein